jgi:hypothetical protein
MPNLLFTTTSADILFMLQVLIGPILVIVLAVAAYLFTRYSRSQGTKLKDFPQVTQDIEAYLESQGEKHSLTAADLQNIEKTEKGFRNYYLLMAAVVMGLGLICMFWVSANEKHPIIVIALGAICAALGIGMARFGIVQSSKRVYAARSGGCNAYILDVTEKLWYMYRLADGWGYCFFIRCGECLVQVPGIGHGNGSVGPGKGPSRKTYDEIGGRLLVVNYLHDPRGTTTSYYPIAM